MGEGAIQLFNPIIKITTRYISRKVIQPLGVYFVHEDVLICCIREQRENKKGQKREGREGNMTSKEIYKNKKKRGNKGFDSFLKQCDS